jgi:hypothetical protein
MALNRDCQNGIIMKVQTHGSILFIGLLLVCSALPLHYYHSLLAFPISSFFQATPVLKDYDEGLTKIHPLTSTMHHAPFNFSACLMLKDQNKILPEWLAYHYEVLPLRRLIIGVDPFSETSPDTIVQAFHEIGMEISVGISCEVTYV